MSPMQKAHNVVVEHLNTDGTVAILCHREETVGNLFPLGAAVIGPALVNVRIHKGDNVIVGGNRNVHQSVMIKINIGEY